MELATLNNEIVTPGTAFRAIREYAVLVGGLDPVEVHSLCVELDGCIYFREDESRAAEIAEYLGIDGAGFQIVVEAA